MTQHDIDRPLFPEQGCFIWDFWMPPFDFTGVKPDARLFERIYDDCLSGSSWNGMPIIEIRESRGKKILVCNDPSKALQMAASYVGGVTGRQFPDAVGKWPDSKPAHYNVQYTVVQYRLPPLNHYVLADSKGLHIVSDSAPGKIDGWDRTGLWRGVQVWSTL